MPDHVHLCIAIPPKVAVAQVIGCWKGKRAIAIARQFGGQERNFTGEHFWARGYAVSPVGFELEQIRAYIRKQEDEDPDDGGKFSASLLRGRGYQTRVTAFEAALLIKPPALRGVSD